MNHAAMSAVYPTPAILAKGAAVLAVPLHLRKIFLT
jgi:hypothetical protein